MITRSGLKTHSRYKIGIWAEYWAACVLTLKGYRVRALRYKTKVGEIDLIARRGKTIIFVEVKYRPDQAQAIAAVQPQAQKRIRRAAEYYLQSINEKESFTFDPEIRFDVIGITPKLGIRHVKNAF